MLDIKLSTCAPLWPWARQTPSGSLVWGDCRFHVDHAVEHCDAWVVFESMEAPQSTSCPADNVVLVTGEPDSIGRYNPRFVDQFRHVVSGRNDLVHPRQIRRQQGHPWFVEKSYDDLKAMAMPPKTRDMCVIVSDKAFTEGHRQRLDFVRAITARLGSRIDVWGRGIRDFSSKWDVLSSYRYALVLENFEGDDFLTEKLPDALLAFCVPMYSGCTNASRYLPADSWIDLDIRDPDAAVALIEALLANADDYRHRLASVCIAREEYLEKVQFFANLVDVLHGVMSQSVTPPGRVELYPDTHFVQEETRQRESLRLSLEAAQRIADAKAAAGTGRLVAGALRVAAWRSLEAAERLYPMPSMPVSIVAPEPAHREPTLKERSHQRWLAADGDRTLRLNYPLQRRDVVLDVGGFEGQWASDIFSRYLCTVHVFEPVPSFAQSIRSRFANNPSIELHEAALGARDGVLSISVAGDASSSIAGTEHTLQAKVLGFTDWLVALGLTEVALMKVNIEGGEFELLEHAIATGAIKRVRDIQVQFHDFVPDARTRMDALLSGLARTHRPTYQFPFIWENWTRKEQAS